MALGITNITTSIVRTALGETINTVAGLCASSLVNQWSWVKPARYSVNYNAYEAKGLYIPCVGVPSSSLTYPGYRLGDFRFYHHGAAKPLDWTDGASVSLTVKEDEPQATEIAPTITKAALSAGNMPIPGNFDGFEPQTFFYYNSGFKFTTMLGATAAFYGIGLTIRDGLAGTETDKKLLSSTEINGGVITPNGLSFTSLGTKTVYMNVYQGDQVASEPVEWTKLYTHPNTISVLLTGNGSAWLVEIQLKTSVRDSGLVVGEFEIDYDVTKKSGPYSSIDITFTMGGTGFTSILFGNKTSRTITVTHGASGTVSGNYVTSNNSSNTLYAYVKRSVVLYQYDSDSEPAADSGGGGA